MNVDQWYVYGRNGGSRGPASKAELDRWVAEGTVTGECMVFREGDNQWRWAADVYPSLRQPTATRAERFHDEPKPDWRDDDDDEGPVTVPVRLALERTRPWVVFQGIAGFVACGLMVIAGIAIVAMAPRVGPDAAKAFRVGVVYLVIAGIYAALGWMLIGYGNRIGDFSRRCTADNLEAALKAQLAFWQLAGIITAVALAVSAVVGTLVGLAGPA